MAEILIVNSDTTMRELLYDMLAKQKHTPSTASSGTQALEMLKSRRPQLILLDSDLTGRSWLDTAREIRSFDDAIPIVLLRGTTELAGKAEELKRLQSSRSPFTSRHQPRLSAWLAWWRKGAEKSE
jgi:DNA-binding response OmpR family regulator